MTEPGGEPVSSEPLQKEIKAKSEEEKKKKKGAERLYLSTANVSNHVTPTLIGQIMRLTNMMLNKTSTTKYLPDSKPFSS